MAVAATSPTSPTCLQQTYSFIVQSGPGTSPTRVRPSPTESDGGHLYSQNICLRDDGGRGGESDESDDPSAPSTNIQFYRTVRSWDESDASPTRVRLGPTDAISTVKQMVLGQAGAKAAPKSQTAPDAQPTNIRKLMCFPGGLFRQRTLVAVM